MKVVKHGNPDRPWSMQVKCHRCGAILEVEQSDVRWEGDFVPRHSHDVEGDLVGEHFMVKCPDCQTDNDIRHALPQHIQGRLRPLL